MLRARMAAKGCHFMRVMVVTVSPLLAELVTGVLAPSMDIEVIGRLDGRGDLARQMLDLRPDLVLIGLVGSETHDIALTLLDILPSVKILVLARDATRAWLFTSKDTCSFSSDLSVLGLIGLLAPLGIAPSQG
jgi:hypothetical protein